MEVEITTINQPTDSKKPASSVDPSTQPRGRKKRSAISKITEKRRQSESGSEFGSTFSIQSNASRVTEVKNVDIHKINSKARDDVNQNQNASEVTNNTSENTATRDRELKKESVKKESVKTPKPKPREKKSESVLRPQDLSPPPMDIDSDSDKDDVKDNNTDGISKKAPSDATIHRFRALKMATNERTNSVESLRNSPFAPKPPSTPRSEQKSSSSKTPTSTPESDKAVSPKVVKQKGEKRFRDPYSSSEEPEVGVKSKKQSSSQTDLKSMDDVFVSDGTNNNKDLPSPQEDPNLTLDSEADMKDIKSRYKDIISGENLPRKTGRLSPLLTKNHPPPLSEDISSHTLKTAYKTDPSYTLNKYFATSVPGSPGVPGSSPIHKPPAHPAFDTMSQRSMSSSGILYQIPITEARAR